MEFWDDEWGRLKMVQCCDATTADVLRRFADYLDETGLACVSINLVEEAQRTCGEMVVREMTL